MAENMFGKRKSREVSMLLGRGRRVIKLESRQQLCKSTLIEVFKFSSMYMWLIYFHILGFHFCQCTSIVVVVVKVVCVCVQSIKILIYNT